MSGPTTAQVMADVEDLLAYRAELLARGVPPGDTLVIIGCALGVRIAGGA